MISRTVPEPQMREHKQLCLVIYILGVGKVASGAAFLALLHVMQLPNGG